MIFKNKKLSPMLKWRGGKSSDLKHLRNNFPEIFPEKIKRYYEPFLGGGAVWLAIKSESMFVNDICEDLIDFYFFIKNKDEYFFKGIENIKHAWDILRGISSDCYSGFYQNNFDLLDNYDIKSISLLDDCSPVVYKGLKDKIKRVHNLDKKNGIIPSEKIKLDSVESGLKIGYYNHVRDIYNNFIKTNETRDGLRSACFYFLRNYAFASTFRYNQKGYFNTGYGGISYNNKNPDSRFPHWKSEEMHEHLKNTVIESIDFEDFIHKHDPGEEDFMFVDPPYDTEFNVYANKTFDLEDQKRLANCLNNAKFQYVAVMKKTDYIYDLYKNSKCLVFDKNYQVNVKNRNNQQVEHLVVYKKSPLFRAG